MEKPAKEQLERMYVNDKKSFDEWSIYFYNNDRNYYKKIVRPIIHELSPNMRSTKKITIIVIVFVVFIFLINLSFNQCKKNIDKDDISEVKVTASKLSLDYEENSVAADKKYKNKILYVTGNVYEVDEDLWGTIYVTLENNRHSGGVRCYFSDTHKDRIADLSKGEKIKVKGKCVGKSIFYAALERCVIEW